MNTTKQAIEVLADAERRLRELVGAAAVGGEYDAVAHIAEWARAVGGIARNGRDDVATHTALEMSTLNGRQDFDRNLAPEVSPQRDGTARRAGALPRRPKRAPTKGEYPKFFRRGNQLVKVGWSKKERAEYEHKAPRRVADALGAAITKHSANGKVFSAEQLFPLTDPDDGSEIPGYQAYVALAWFKSAGLVKQHGRRGYSSKKERQLSDAVSMAWAQLPEKPV